MVHTTIREVQIQYKRKRALVDKITRPEDAATIFRRVAPNNSQEHFLAIFLGGDHSIIGYSVIATGTANACTLHHREIFQRAFILGAVSIITGHNHPSGSLTPSDKDIHFGKQLKDASSLLGIRLLDNLIFTDCGHNSEIW